MLIWWVILGRASAAWAAGRALCHLAGALAPPALYLAWCAAAGNADATIYWFAFNFSYVGAGLTGLAAVARGLRRTLMIGGVALVPYALGLAAAVTVAGGVARALRARRRGREAAASAGAAGDAGMPAPAAVLGLLWLATSAVAVTAGGRFFGHYFHLILPPLCLLAAPAFLPALARGLVPPGAAHRAVRPARAALLRARDRRPPDSPPRSTNASRPTTRSRRASPRSPRRTTGSSSGVTRRSSTCWPGARWGRGSASATT